MKAAYSQRNYSEKWPGQTSHKQTSSAHVICYPTGACMVNLFSRVTAGDIAASTVKLTRVKWATVTHENVAESIVKKWRLWNEVLI